MATVLCLHMNNKRTVRDCSELGSTERSQPEDKAANGWI